MTFPIDITSYEAHGSWLKLVRTHLKYRFITPPFYLYQYALFTSDECHAWFHLYGLRWATRKVHKYDILKENDGVGKRQFKWVRTSFNKIAYIMRF